MFVGAAWRHFALIRLVFSLNVNLRCFFVETPDFRADFERECLVCGWIFSAVQPVMCFFDCKRDRRLKKTDVHASSSSAFFVYLVKEKKNV